MARYFDDSQAGPYRVELAVKVWRQLDALSPDSVERLQEGLRRIAKEAGAHAGSSPVPLMFHVSVDGLEITYELSRIRRTLTLLSVGAPASTGK